MESISSPPPHALSTYYPPSGPPRCWVALDINLRDEPDVAGNLVQAVVDSGADRSVLPLTVAAQLAIVDTLVRDARAGLGVEGRAFPLWRSSAVLHAQVVTDVGRRWGPRFRLDPMFADADVALLGREDFFRAFTITFQEHATTPVYHLDPA